MLEKKRISFYIIRIMAVLVTGVLLLFVRRSNGLKRVLGLENRYQWIDDVLSQSSDKYTELPVEVGTLMESYPWAEEENLLVSQGLSDMEVAGVRITNEGDTLLLDGTAHETAWPGVTSEQFQLDKGIYYISSGIDDGEVFCYLEGWNEGTSYWLVENLGEDVFCVSDPDAFPDGYKFTMYLNEGQTVDHLILAPRLIKLADLSDETERMKLRIQSGISRAKWDALSEEKQQFLLRVLCTQNSDCAWSSIVFDDGTGIQYRQGEIREGVISMLGVVE